MKNFPNLIPTSINLGKDETILWIGNPNPGIKFHPRVIAAFGLWTLLTIIAVFIRSINGTFFYFVMSFILVTLFNIAYLLLVDPIRRQKTRYLVTNQRIVIISNFISQSIRQVRLNTINDVNLKVYRDGTGTIIFDKFSWRDRSSLPPYHLLPVFEFIEEPDNVCNIIEKARILLLKST
ncbi:MAG: hypothetical protein JW908_15590 [Anaerolineales bacterium]|nr:hypothetical protein [Anaerolineales bacterium]